MWVGRLGVDEMQLIFLLQICSANFIDFDMHVNVLWVIQEKCASIFVSFFRY